MFIVSNCQAGYIETFRGWNGMATHFRDFECGGNTGLSKAGNLARIIERNGLCSPVLVGDAPGDQAAALECGVPFAYVDWGFCGCESPDHHFSSFDGLTEWLLSRLQAEESRGIG